MKKIKIIRCKKCDKEIVKKSHTHKFCSEKCKDKYIIDYDYNYANKLSERGWGGHKNSF